MSEQCLHPEIAENPEGVKPVSEKTQREVLGAIHSLVSNNAANPHVERAACFSIDDYPDSRVDITIYEPGAFCHDTVYEPDATQDDSDATPYATRIATIRELYHCEYSEDATHWWEYHCLDVPGGWLFVKELKINDDVQLPKRPPGEDGADLAQPVRQPEYSREAMMGLALSDDDLTTIETDSLNGYIEGMIEGGSNQELLTDLGLSEDDLIEIATNALRGYIEDTIREEFDRGISIVSEEDARKLLYLLEGVNRE